MSATGAAPPPPSPPPGSSVDGNPFEDLPAELLLIIYRYAGLGNFANLALAIYPTLQRHNLAPELSSATLSHIELRTTPCLSASFTAPGAPRLPNELWLQIAQYMEPVDTMSLVFALGPWFRERPNRETRDRLRIWSRRCRRK